MKWGGETWMSPKEGGVQATGPTDPVGAQAAVGRPEAGAASGLMLKPGRAGGNHPAIPSTARSENRYETVSI